MPTEVAGCQQLLLLNILQGPVSRSLSVDLSEVEGVSSLVRDLGPLGKGIQPPGKSNGVHDPTKFGSSENHGLNLGCFFPRDASMRIVAQGTILETVLETWKHLIEGADSLVIMNRSLMML